MDRDIIFEKLNGDGWEPVSSSSLKVGDIARLKDTQGNIVEAECRVSQLHGRTEETAQAYDLLLEPIGG